MDSTIHLALPRSKWNVPPKDCRVHTGNGDNPWMEGPPSQQATLAASIKDT